MAGVAALWPALANDFPGFAKLICWCWWLGVLLAARQSLVARISGGGEARTAVLLGLGLVLLLSSHAVGMAETAGGRAAWVLITPGLAMLAVSGLVFVRGLQGLVEGVTRGDVPVNMGVLGVVGLLAAIALGIWLLGIESPASTFPHRSFGERRVFGSTTVVGACLAAAAVGRLPRHASSPRQLLRVATGAVAVGVYGTGFAIWIVAEPAERLTELLPGPGFALFLGLVLLLGVALRRFELLEAEERDEVDGPDVG